MVRSSREEAAGDPPRPAWVYDAITENAPLGTTGGLVWDAARRLARFIEREGCLASGAVALPSARAPFPVEAAASGSVEQPQPPGAAQGQEQSQPPGTALGREQLQPPGMANERQQPTSVLELGAGCGWLGLTLVRNLPSVHVTVTEQEAGGGLAWLRHNVQLNRSLDPSGAARITCRACDWNDFLGGEAGLADGEAAPTQRRPSGGDGPQPSGPGCDGGPNHEHVPNGNVPIKPTSSAPISTAPRLPTSTSAASPSEPAAAAGPPIARICPSTGRPWDWLLGSDLIYTEGGCRALPRVIRSLATPDHTRILYCHTKHRFDNLDLMLMEELASCGLSCQEVREQGEPSPPPSPPPLTELFPDMRIAVYCLSFL